MNRDLIRYLLKFLVFAFIFIAVDKVAGFGLDFLQQKSFERNPYRFEVRARYAIEKAEGEIAVIGASDAAHSYISQMIEDSLRLTTFNYGKDGCFFVYQNCLINMMLANHTPKVILWEIGKDCLSSTPAKNITEWQSISDFYPYYDNNRFCKHLIDQKGTFQRCYMLSSLYRFNSKALNIIEPFLVTETIPDTKGYLAIANTGYKYPDFNTSETKDNLDTWKVELLKSTLDVCKEKNATVIFCFSPYFGDSGYDKTQQYKELMTIAEDYSVDVIDYRNNSFFMSDATLFKDPRHLNDKGAHLYMDYFIPDLKKLLARQ